MNRRFNFTVKALNALRPAPAGKRAYYNDANVRGLQLVVTDRGTMTFYLYRKIAGKPKRVHLGGYPAMTIEQGRKAAHRELHRIMDGVDPVAEKKTERARAVTLAQAFEQYREARVSLKPKTLYDYGRILAVAFPDWLNRPLLAITKDMVAKRHRKLGEHHGEYYANGAMRVLRALFNFAAARYEDPEGRSLVPDNPVRRLSQTRAWYRQRRRDTVIKVHELPAWFKAVRTLAEEDPNGRGAIVADYLLLMLFTGLRRSEAAALAWDRVDLKARTLIVRDTKNRENHTLPLSGFLHDLLQRRKREAADPYVFPGQGASGYLIEPRAQVQRVITASNVDFTLHDLRRTFLTVAESLDIPAYALKRLVNHKMRGDVTAGYIITDVERLRRPMQAITDYLLSAAGQHKSRVIKLAEGRKVE